MNVYEMEGFLRGKSLPGDLLVGESHAEYLVRKLNEATSLKAERDALERQLSMSEAKCKGYFSDAAAALVRCDALAVENAALINSSVCTLQDCRPQHGFYASEWFIAKLKNGQYAALKALPEEYSHDYRTNDGTYYTKDWVVGWMQTPDTEYRPNVKTPATDAALAAIEARGVENFAVWASEQESMASDSGDKKEARIYCQVAARAKHFAKQLREAK